MSIRYRVRSLFALPALAFLSLLAASPASALFNPGDVLITSDASNIVRAYDGTTGIFLSNHCASVNALGQLGIHFGPFNGKFLVGSFSGGVDEFDAASGAYIKTYNTGGGTQWAGIYRPNGNVYIGSWSTGDVREYDGTTGAFIRVLCTVPDPSDMRFGLNGNLYICSYTTNSVFEVHPVVGAPINTFFTPAGTRPNDIAFLPNGNILVTCMGTNLCYVFDPSLTIINSFSGTGWFRPHGIDIGPVDGNVYIIDGVTTQVHVFDPITFAELNANWRSPDPDDKIVDLEFWIDNRPTPVEDTTWGRLKTLYR